MRRIWIFIICCQAGLTGLNPAYSQQKSKAEPKQNPSSLAQKNPAVVPAGTKAAKTQTVPNSVRGLGYSSTAQDYQKDNPLLRVDLEKNSKFQGKMFEIREVKLKEFHDQDKFKKPVMNNMFSQSSTFQPEKNKWQGNELPQAKLSGLNGQFIAIQDQRAKFNNATTAPKQAKGFDAKAEGYKKAEGFAQMLPDGQIRYAGEVATEMELIQERLKKSGGTEDLRKNQLSAAEVKTLLQPRDPMTRPK